MTMGIDGIQGNRDDLKVEKRGQNTSASNRTTSRASENEDSVELSSATQEYLRIRKLVDTLPDVRYEKIAQLKQEISNGTYNVPASDIAEAIVDEWI
jgi:negative regulator of flagellin synthesis FlgM